MALPSSGQISFSQIASIVYANAGVASGLNDSDIRYLLDKTSGQIAISDGYSKPANNSYSYTSSGAYSLVVPAYQYMAADVRGGGGGGNGGSGSDTCVGWCGQLCFFPYCCNGRGGEGGGAGGSSYFRVGGIDVTAYGGSGGASGGGYGGDVITGGGGTGGSAGSAFGCSGGNGSAGGGGGRVTNSWTKGVNGPGYATTASIFVGGGGNGGYNAGGTGGTGAVYVSVWS
jgi:hypothetical protein